MIGGKRILGVLAGKSSHYAHRALLGAVCDEIKDMGSTLYGSGSILDIAGRGALLLFGTFSREFAGSDIIISESPLLSPSLYKKFGRKRQKLIVMMASPGIYKVFSNKVAFPVGPLAKDLIMQSDAFLPVGKMCADFLREKGIDRPMEVFYPFVEDGKYGALAKNRYDVKSKVLIGIGSPVEYKGIDVLIKVFDRVADKDEDVTLTLVTKSLDKRYLEGIKHAERIQVLSDIGNADYCRVLGSAAVCVHLGRFDTFPVSTLEAMLAGVPTFVSVQSGTKELMDERFVLDFDPQRGAERILWFLSLPQTQKKGYSEKSKAAAMPFNRAEMVKDFRAKVERLVAQLS